jgi:hypothetical protein
MWKIILLIILGLTVIIAVALVYGSSRWQTATKEIHAKLEAARLPIESKTFDARELEDLPAPAQRYFQAVLKEGQPMVAAVSLEHTGTFNMSETGEKWKPFTSTQRVIVHRPGFDWEARIQIAPGLAAKVHDAYIGGEGILHASLFGLVSLVKLRGTPEVAQGELMRFFAETPWYPTALLPSQGMQWEAVDDTSAKATLTDGETTVTMLFRFNENGLIESGRAEARGRTVAGTVVPTPWEGRWSNYELRNGMRIPIEGEVAWMLPEGPKPYWRGRITKLSYEFAQ